MSSSSPQSIQKGAKEQQNKIVEEEEETEEEEEEEEDVDEEEIDLQADNNSNDANSSWNDILRLPATSNTTTGLSQEEIEEKIFKEAARKKNNATTDTTNTSAPEVPSFLNPQLLSSIEQHANVCAYNLVSLMSHLRNGLHGVSYILIF